MAVKPIPEGSHAVTPYLMVEGAAQRIEFLKQGFGAQEIARTMRPDGGLMHAESRSAIPGMEAGDTTPAMRYVYVDDNDAVCRRALAAGAAWLREPADPFDGDRGAGVKDAWGNRWRTATHSEDLAPDERARRVEAFFQQRHAGWARAKDKIEIGR